MACKPVKWLCPFQVFTKTQSPGLSDRRWLYSPPSNVRRLVLQLFLPPPIKKLDVSWKNIFKSVVFSRPYRFILILFLYKYKAWSKQTPREISVKWQKWRDCPHLSRWPPDSQGKLSTARSTQISCWHLKFNMSCPPLTSCVLLSRPCFRPSSPPVSWVTQSEHTPSQTSDSPQWPLPLTPPTSTSHQVLGLFPPLACIPSVSRFSLDGYNQPHVWFSGPQLGPPPRTHPPRLTQSDLSRR